MFFRSSIILSVAMQFPSFVLLSEGCSIIMLYLIGLDLSLQTPLRRRAVGIDDRGVKKSIEEARHQETELQSCGQTEENPKHSMFREGFYLKLLEAT